MFNKAFAVLKKLIRGREAAAAVEARKPVQKPDLREIEKKGTKRDYSETRNWNMQHAIKWTNPFIVRQAKRALRFKNWQAGERHQGTFSPIAPLLGRPVRVPVSPVAMRRRAKKVAWKRERALRELESQMKLAKLMEEAERKGVQVAA